MAEDLLTTGAVAELLGCSRQHVVDLCEAGALRYQSVGTHRRIRRHDAEALSKTRLSRDEERLLWLHHAVAGHLVNDPDRVLDQAEVNLAVMLEAHPRGMARHWLAQWRTLLDSGISSVLDALTSRSANARDLRQNSPFAGVLTDDERSQVLASFRASWKREQRR